MSASANDLTWAVRPNEFPFGVSRETLGTVDAPDKATAQKAAECLYGRAVVVERASASASPLLTEPDAAAPALTCPDCGAPLALRPGRYGPYFACTQREKTGCRGGVGAHPDGRPMGVPATHATRRARVAAHAAFDRLWMSGTLKRRAAYAWLQRAMGMTADEAHIGNFDAAQCARVVELVEAEIGAELAPMGGGK